MVAVAVLAVLASACASESERSTPADPSGVRGGPSAALEAVRLRAVATVDTPIALVPRPGTTDLYVAEQAGMVRQISVSGEGTSRVYDVARTPALDLTGRTRAAGEQGLLGLAFSPDGSRLYVNFTDDRGDTRVVEYPMEGTTADADEAREILLVEQPYANHNGGQLAFGPDGYLYVALGDGGGSDDPQRRAQDPDDLLGKILRIDPLDADGAPGGDGAPYAIPADNPHADGGGRPEVWISGARNPWRFSFDQETDDLWIADVGQNEIEEINFLPTQTGITVGANLGWPFYEGTDPHLDTPPDDASFIEPVHTYRHEGGDCSVTGGYVYRGSAIPFLVGSYVFGDYCSARIDALGEAGDGSWTPRPLEVSVAANSLSSFGQDLDGEIYVLSTEGSIYRMDPA